MFYIFAHRGGIVDSNTANAFLSCAKLCHEVGINGIECDVCLSKDGEPIIYHPGTKPGVEPTDMAWEQIKKTDVPHLDELIDILLVYTKMKCLLDIKQDSKELIEIVVDKISQAKLLGRVFLTAPKYKNWIVGMTVNAEALKYARQIEPKVKIHVMDLFPFNIAKTAKDFKADIVSFGWLPDSLPSKILYNSIFESGFKNIALEILSAHSSGTYVLGGIANTDNEFRKLLISNKYPTRINAILTDFPMAAVLFRSHIKSPCL